MSKYDNRKTRYACKYLRKIRFYQGVSRNMRLVEAITYNLSSGSVYVSSWFDMHVSEGFYANRK